MKIYSQLLYSPHPKNEDMASSSTYPTRYISNCFTPPPPLHKNISIYNNLKPSALDRQKKQTLQTHQNHPPNIFSTLPPIKKTSQHPHPREKFQRHNSSSTYHSRYILTAAYPKKSPHHPKK